ncbi:MAG: ASCH domain-containing protein [Burkholderiaceae bacterium]|nr:ASCH domain-containing protein [Burkholderiaceae bacterium]
MPVPSELQAFWCAAQAANPAIDAARFYEAFAFGDSERMADELAQLVLAGTKRATASLAWTYEVEHKPRPQAGDLSIVTLASGRPVCIIETTAVDVVPFDEVTEDFAATEGEDDGTLASWRRGHAAFFARDCARIGREPHPRMEVLCERFRVVYQPDGAGVHDPGRGPA